MERGIRICWPDVVETARQRRKAEGLTQRRLAAIADVSTPTVSRFEQGDRNLQLASALAILDALGMLVAPDDDAEGDDPAAAPTDHGFP